MRRALSVLAVIVVLGAASPVSAAVLREPSSWDFGTKIVRVFRGVLRALGDVEWPKP